MVRITFIQADGASTTHDLEPGDSIMERALALGVPGLGGQCAGAIRCSTCLVHVPPAWLARLPMQDPDEVELLGYVGEALPNSRLTCQIPVVSNLDGLVLQVPMRKSPERGVEG